MRLRRAVSAAPCFPFLCIPRRQSSAANVHSSGFGAASTPECSRPHHAAVCGGVFLRGHGGGRRQQLGSRQRQPHQPRPGPGTSGRHRRARRRALPGLFTGLLKPNKGLSSAAARIAARPCGAPRGALVGAWHMAAPSRCFRACRGRAALHGTHPGLCCPGFRAQRSRGRSHARRRRLRLRTSVCIVGFAAPTQKHQALRSGSAFARDRRARGQQGPYFRFGWGAPAPRRQAAAAAPRARAAAAGAARRPRRARARAAPRAPPGAPGGRCTPPSRPPARPPRPRAAAPPSRPPRGTASRGPAGAWAARAPPAPARPIW